MLVLSRKRDEAVIINGETTIYIVDIRGDKVRLGIETPVSHSVHRKEVYDALQKENEKYQKDMKSVELMFVLYLDIIQRSATTLTAPVIT